MAANGCQFQRPNERSVATMKDITLRRMRVRRFISDRYVYRAQLDYSSELITFGVIVLTASWSMFVLASAMAGTLK
jgi:hypothetical protein